MVPVKRILVLLAHGLVAWVLLLGVRALALRTAPEAVAVVHAVAAPLVAATVCAAYYGRFGFTSPLVTALAMLATVACLDGLWAFFVEKRLGEFSRSGETWLSLALLFAQALASGIVDRRSRPGAAP